MAHDKVGEINEPDHVESFRTKFGVWSLFLGRITGMILSGGAA